MKLSLKQPLSLNQRRKINSQLVDELVADARRLQRVQAQAEIMSSHIVMQTVYGWTVRAFHPEEKVYTDDVVSRKSRQQRDRDAKRARKRREREHERECERLSKLRRLDMARRHAREMEARWGDYI